MNWMVVISIFRHHLLFAIFKPYYHAYWTPQPLNGLYLLSECPLHLLCSTRHLTSYCRHIRSRSPNPNQKVLSPNVLNHYEDLFYHSPRCLYANALEFERDFGVYPRGGGVTILARDMKLPPYPAHLHGQFRAMKYQGRAAAKNDWAASAAHEMSTLTEGEVSDQWKRVQNHHEGWAEGHKEKQRQHHRNLTLGLPPNAQDEEKSIRVSKASMNQADLAHATAVTAKKELESWKRRRT